MRSMLPSPNALDRTIAPLNAKRPIRNGWAFGGQLGRSGGSLGELLDALLQGTHRIIGRLAHERAEILGLHETGLETTTPVLGVDVERLDRRLGGQEVAHCSEAGISVFLGDIEQLEAGLGGSLARVEQLAVQLVRRGLCRLADLLEALDGPARADLSELADAVACCLGGLGGMLDHVVERGCGRGHDIPAAVGGVNLLTGCIWDGYCALQQEKLCTARGKMKNPCLSID